jgi:hypothetical protein
MMQKVLIDTSNLSTIAVCLEQLVNAERAQLSIEHQLDQSTSSAEFSSWRKSAEKALRAVKAKRRLITAQLAVLRQQEKKRTKRIASNTMNISLLSFGRLLRPLLSLAASVMQPTNWRLPVSESNVFELVKLIKAANGDPSSITDSIWEAGYRQPERTAEEAAKITISVFFYCNSLGCRQTSGREIMTVFCKMS